MITPPLQPGKRFPVFFSHYGGPHAQVVTRGWTGALAQAIVAQGYIWFELDNRGSANRGVAFESQIWHAMGSVEVADQLAGAAYLKTLTFVDPAKIATYGWSYGGYMTLKLLEAAAGGVCRRNRRRARDQVGIVRHPLHRALSRRSARGAAGLYAPPMRWSRRRRSPTRCC